MPEVKATAAAGRSRGWGLPENNILLFPRTFLVRFLVTKNEHYNEKGKGRSFKKCLFIPIDALYHVLLFPLMEK